jgi:hypothetical protein
MILSDIAKHAPVFLSAGGCEYRIRCPFCGDSQTDPNDAHCYIKCSDDPNEPMLYYCFKCNAKGRVTPKFLTMLGVDKSLVGQFANQRYYKLNTYHEPTVDIVERTPVMDSPQVRYIEERLGKFEASDYERFKILWNINDVIPYIMIKQSLNTLPSNKSSVSFISDDKSALLIRSFDPQYGRWRKLSMFPTGRRTFYTVKAQVNLLSMDQIIIHIAEGVFDVLSAYRNFSEEHCQHVYIAALGSDYAKALEHFIAKGIFGSNCSVRIYYDADIDVEKLKKKMRQYKWLYHDICLYKNILSKDIGVPADQIRLVSMKV